MLSGYQSFFNDCTHALVTPGVNIGGGNQVGTSKNGNSSQVGPIVGGIIGGIAATLLIIGLIILWRRRHRDLRKDSFENHSGGADIRARPYDLSDNTFAMSGPFSSGVMQDSHISLSASQPISPVGTKGRNPISARASSEGLLQHQSNTSSSGSAEPTEEYIRARDAGPVPVASAPNRTRVVELPPLYQDIAGGKRT
ncbi:hypothetical protein FRC03_001980 [Tulasnella sp. 419]|nr:hypothetical protein FRC03_001980 [Tulasnella sp. 419]